MGLLRRFAAAAAFAAPVAGAAVVFALGVGGREAPARSDAPAPPTPVTVIAASPGPVTPTLVAYGVAGPKTRWRAVAQVSGPVARLAPDLDAGAFLAAGAEIAVIDPADFAGAVARAEADADAAHARVAELEAEGRAWTAMLGIERERLALSEADAVRQRALMRTGVSAAARVDQAERDLLTQRAKLQEMENALAMLPSRLRAAQAQARAADTRVADAARDLARTRIALPMDARVAAVEVEEGERVGVGATIAVFEGTDAAQIVAQAPERAFAQFAALAGPDPAGWRVAAEGVHGARAARAVRLSPQIDAAARSVGVVVEIDAPFAPGPNPPLPTGAFVTLRISGAPLPDRVALPVEAVRDGAVYLVDAQDRLRIRPVQVVARQDGQAVLARGALPADARVVLGELTPAMEGMRLAPMAVDGGPDGAIAAR